MTEPAFGAGIGGGVLYFHERDESESKRADGTKVPPSMSFGGGVATENGTWAAFLGHSGVWNEGRTRYLGAAVAADIRLDFFGVQGSNELDDGIGLRMQAVATLHDLRFEVLDHLFVGGKYSIAGVDTQFDLNLPGQPIDSESTVAGLGAVVAWDDRDNTFTPDSGTRAEATVRWHDDWLGSDFQYAQLDLIAFHWAPLGSKWVLGLRGEFHGAGDEAPFYALPFLRMRGVPAFRYLGDYTLTGEVEPRFKIDERWSVVGFIAAGAAVGSVSDFGSSDTIVAGGGGFRYLLARKLGFAAGLDVAQGPEDTTVHLVFGTYWQSF